MILGKGYWDTIWYSRCHLSNDLRDESLSGAWTDWLSSDQMNSSLDERDDHLNQDFKNKGVMKLFKILNMKGIENVLSGRRWRSNTRKWIQTGFCDISALMSMIASQLGEWVGSAEQEENKMLFICEVRQNRIESAGMTTSPHLRGKQGCQLNRKRNCWSDSYNEVSASMIWVRSLMKIILHPR